jgi:hypothetical protein
VRGFRADIFSEWLVFNLSNCENHPQPCDESLMTENINEKERDSRTVVPLNNSMAAWVETTDCALHLYPMEGCACKGRGANGLSPGLVGFSNKRFMDRVAPFDTVGLRD